MKIKIIGAGSAGNHMAHALTTIKEINKIVVTDVSKEALSRSKNQIYLKRYKKWNDKLFLEIEKKNLKENNFYDAIIISSPPKFHKDNIINNIDKTDVFLIEKPLCLPFTKEITFFKNLKKKYKNKIFMTGYNHRLFPSTQYLKKIIQNKKIQYCKVSFKENIGGFLKAHTWMKSINESYLSKTKFGGGSLCEHSHALNLVQFVLNDKKIKIIDKSYKFNKDKKNYHDLYFGGRLKINDTICEFEQNFETLPIEKKISVKTKNNIVELIYNYKENNDLIIVNNFKKIKKYYFNKSRRDDFIYEANYLYKIITKRIKKNVLEISNGISTMETINKMLKGLI